MRIGAICRMDKTGLGVQSKEFFDNFKCKALVIDIGGRAQYPNWYPNQTIIKINKVGYGSISEEIINEFINDIDVLITFEIPYDPNIFILCKRKGVKTILQLNYEFLEYPSNLPYPDLFAAPSMWHYEDIPPPKVFLPVPVNVSYFTPIKKKNTFVHIAGNHAIFDRNGTMCFLKCLQHVNNEITVILKSQYHLDLRDFVIPENVTLIKDFSNKENYYDNYEGGVLVMPRKYGGLSLPVNEAIAAEMPVIMTDISPNNTWLPKEWLVQANKVNILRCKKEVAVYEADHFKLANKIDEFCDESFYETAVNVTKGLKSCISFEALMPKYHEVFNKLMG